MSNPNNCSRHNNCARSDNFVSTQQHFGFLFYSDFLEFCPELHVRPASINSSAV